MSKAPLLYGPDNRPVKSLQGSIDKHLEEVAKIEKQEKNRALANALFKALLGQQVTMVEDDPRFTGLVKIDPNDFFIEIEPFTMQGYRDPVFRAKIMGVVDGENYLVSTMRFVHQNRYMVHERAGKMLPCMPIKQETTTFKAGDMKQPLTVVEFKYPYWDETRVKIILESRAKKMSKAEKRQRDYDKQQEAYKKKHDRNGA